MEYFYAFKDGLKLLFRNFVSFLKRLCVIIFFYGLPMCIPMIAALLIIWVLSLIPGIDNGIISLVFKIVATAGQIIPLSIYLYVAENELKKTQENAPELCFAFCATVITLIWTCL